MNENKNIPQLFRDIFKGVFLPYRDPETLNLFLKEINGFSYDHSERLGDAFEYLLSVLGTQGDAGQFRTPRHIIDFIVAVVDPKKHETVLDPACGTAGFLVSAFKHILRNNENLTPDERARLMTNFRGYDIAPDMVRLSRANLYLHGFPNPVIHEYDTLTSEERWDERCDVILANPPFMSPKGGIRPHNRFSIKAKRSEVLFVDYMAEHLNSGGRAGIIVPEGIIFQSQNAYKALRKMLVENYLWAVVSLPGGVFNPYAGVKTSILFLDRNLARRTDELLFLKVESDGFDLGAQRRPNGKNDLPEALKILDGHKKEQKTQESKLALTVSRKRLLESPDINLSGDRYRTAATRPSGKWPMVKLGEVCSFEYGSSLPERNRVSGPFPVVGSNGIAGFHKDFTVKGPAIVVGRKGSAGEVTWIDQDCVPIDTTYYVCIKQEAVLLRYLFYVLEGLRLTELRGGAGVPGLNRNDAYDKGIPLPPLEEQERIVAELDGYRKVIEGARQVLANYKSTIKIDPTWPRVKLGEVTLEIKSGFACGTSDDNSAGVPHFRPMNISTDGLLVWVGTKYISEDFFADKSDYLLRAGDVLFNNTNSKELVGKTCLVDREIRAGYSNHLTRIRLDLSRMMPQLLALLLHEKWRKGEFLNLCNKWIGQAGVNNTLLAVVEIPLPPLAIQREIVAGLESERVLVEANRKLVEIFEKKIQAKLAEVWGEDATETGGSQ